MFIHTFLCSLRRCRVILPRSHDGSVEPKRGLSSLAPDCWLLPSLFFAGGEEFKSCEVSLAEWLKVPPVWKNETCERGWRCFGPAEAQTQADLIISALFSPQYWLLQLDSSPNTSRFNHIGSLMKENKETCLPLEVLLTGALSANMSITYHSSNLLINLINGVFLPSQEI